MNDNWVLGIYFGIGCIIGLIVFILGCVDESRGNPGSYYSGIGGILSGLLCILWWPLFLVALGYMAYNDREQKLLRRGDNGD